MNMVNRESDIPLYKQISDIIIRQIGTGELKPGDKVPSEIELSNIYDVSRMTARQSLNDMIRERILIRRRGYGTFIAEKMVQRTFRPNIITGFFDEFSMQGSPLQSKVVENSLVFPPRSIQSAMGIDEKTLTCKLVRVRYLDSQPLIVDESYIDKECWDQIKDTDFSNISLFAFLANIIGEKPKTADIEVQASSASQSVAGYLQIAQGTPIIKALMSNRYADGRILHAGRLYCPDYMVLKFAIGSQE